MVKLRRLFTEKQGNKKSFYEYDTFEKEKKDAFDGRRKVSLKPLPGMSYVAQFVACLARRMNDVEGQTCGPL